MSRFAYFSERRAVKGFEGLEPRFRELVFYSEGAGDWPHLGPVVECLLRDHDRDITYLSSDASDPGLALDHPGLRSFMVGSGTARTILFARIDCANFVMTLPDIDQLWLKRSSNPVHYVYLFHSMNSTHAAYRKGSFDAYDTVLCVGPHHIEEIRRTEKRYGLPKKNLVEHGSVKLDTVLAEVGERSAAATRARPVQVLVAPSWGDCSLIEAPVGLELLDVLTGAGYKTVLRLHPMTVRRCPKLVAELDRRCAHDPLVDLETDMDATESWLRSDLMISDWSGAAIEYGFSLLRPVLYVDMPQKQMNPDWRAIEMSAFEDEIRSALGSIVAPSEIHTTPAAVEALLADPDARRDRALDARARWVFNVGTSAAVGAEYLASLPGLGSRRAESARAQPRSSG